MASATSSAESSVASVLWSAAGNPTRGKSRKHENIAQIVAVATTSTLGMVPGARPLVD